MHFTLITEIHLDTLNTKKYIRDVAKSVWQHTTNVQKNLSTECLIL